MRAADVRSQGFKGDLCSDAEAAMVDDRVVTMSYSNTSALMIPSVVL